MKGVILAGGTGSRLAPLTRVTNKHLLPVFNEPMIYYPLRTLTEAGVKDIMIVSSADHSGHFSKLLASGKEFGANICYGVQEEAGGIAQALNVARSFIGSDRCVVVLGDNIFEDNVKEFVEKFAEQQSGARIVLKEVSVEAAKRFGCALVEGDKVSYIEEKPENPRSTYAVPGLYMFDSEVFNAIDSIKPSARGELEITDVIDHYIKKGTCYYNHLKGFWSDAGTFESLHRSSNFMKEKRVIA